MPARSRPMIRGRPVPFAQSRDLSRHSLMASRSRPVPLLVMSTAEPTLTTTRRRKRRGHTGHSSSFEASSGLPCRRSARAAFAIWLQGFINGINDSTAAIAADGGDAEPGAIAAVGLGKSAIRASRLGDQVELVEDQPARLGEFGLVIFESSRTMASGHRAGSASDRAERGQRYAQESGARQVLEEADAEVGALGGAFDQAGHVGDDEAAVIVDATTPRFGCSVGTDSRPPWTRSRDGAG